MLDEARVGTKLTMVATVDAGPRCFGGEERSTHKRAAATAGMKMMTSTVAGGTKCGEEEQNAGTWVELGFRTRRQDTQKMRMVMMIEVTMTTVSTTRRW